MTRQRLKHEQDLRKQFEESEEKFRTLADNIPTLTWMANADGWIFWYNSKWYEYTGTTQKDMEGWGWKSVHDSKELPHVLEEWQYSIKNGEPFDMVFPIKGADGIFRPFLTRVIPVKDNKGQINRWFGTNTDITKIKELEKQKDDFIGIASHELKTPLTSVKAYTQILQARFRKSEDMKSAELVGKMDAQLNKLTNLISDLLDVTKIEGGELQFHEDYFDFNELVDEIVEELQRITIKHNFNKDLAKTKSVYGDRNRIGQVITNLLTNAIKYSPNANKIVVHTSSDKNTISLCVQDFGIGITKEKQDKVFERFYRISGPKEDTYPGLGLGLYISSEIIKRQGGSIWVDSVIGKGSTFCFRLPMKKEKNKSHLNTKVEGELSKA